MKPWLRQALAQPCPVRALCELERIAAAWTAEADRLQALGQVERAAVARGQALVAGARAVEFVGVCCALGHGV